MNDMPDAANQQTAIPPLTSAPAEPQYKGVGGWLLLFCLQLTVFIPLFTLGSLFYPLVLLGLLAVRFAGLAGSSEYFAQFPGLLVITVVAVFIPLFTLVSLSIPLIWLGLLAVGFTQFPGLLVITVVSTLLRVSLMAFSIYAGVRLGGIRRGAVRTAKILLLCALAYDAVDVILLFMAGLPSAANADIEAEGAKSIGMGLVFCVIWYSYLNKSQRVRATYQLESK